MKFLKPLILKDNYWKRIDRSIFLSIKRLIYDNLKRDVDTEISLEIKNLLSALIDPILNGTLRYANGFFFGQFSASISKELISIGAKYNKSNKAWRLSKEELPPDIVSALTIRDTKDKKLNDQAIESLDKMDSNDIKPDVIQGIIDDVLGQFDNDFLKTLPKKIESIAIPFEMSEFQKEKISEAWANNLNLSIKDFTDEQILSLRKKVMENTEKGMRAENLEDFIVESFNVSRRKAKFLASHETSLLLSEYRETRYIELGLERYKWSTSNDTKVRDTHRKLNGKIFFFKHPPVVNKKGDRKNPGKDFRCRCIPMVIVE